MIKHFYRKAPWSMVTKGTVRKEKTSHFHGRFVFALPIFTARHQATIVGVCELNFCVRDGNRWTLTTINTNFLGYAPSKLNIKSFILLSTSQHRVCALVKLSAY